ncbi:hypothetical protein RGU74_08235 [Bacillus cereus]|uniref:hypothetical protein n=1 Tax=Bacillus cereus TaxID=1396 RepID=UPI002853482D|nr:hypothetical protein [Bacillus cereus]MDR4983688.1 hypothetical protein [Bacillus cereus]MEA1011327.1 hypothetical protein [Bacillus cereus]
MKKTPMLSKLQGDFHFVDDSDLFVYKSSGITNVKVLGRVKLTTIIESSIRILKQEKIIWKSVEAGESIDYLYC